MGSGQEEAATPARAMLRLVAGDTPAELRRVVERLIKQ